MTNETIVKKLKNGDGNKKELLDVLWGQNAGIINGMAKKYAYISTFEDIKQDLFLLMVSAIKTFNENKGFKFMTWFQNYVGYMIFRNNTNSELARLPEHMRLKVNKYNYFVSNFIRDHGREPSQNEIMYYFHVSFSQLETIEKAVKMSQKHISIDTPLKDSDGLTIADTLEELQARDDTEQDALENYEKQEIKHVVRQEVERLPEKQRDVIKARYLNDKHLTLKEAGERLGVSIERIRQIERDGFRKLRMNRNIKSLLPDKIETTAYRGSYSAFTRSFSSSVENAVLLMEQNEHEEAQRELDNLFKLGRF